MNKYEALGRYVEAKENLDALKREREIATMQFFNFANDLKHVENLGFEPQQRIQKTLSHLEASLVRLQQVNQQIAQLTAQVNDYAENCGKPTIEIR